ncbi:MAG: sigma-54-dependent Fis family transcriptional regulator [Candidatus Binataceae bacterium]
MESESARFKLLYDLGCGFAARLELDELLPFIIKKCRDAMDADGASLLLLDRERNEFYFPYVSGAETEAITRLGGVHFPADQGFAGEALKTGRSVRVDNAQSDARFYHGADETTGLVTRNLIATPLISPQGPLGVIEVVNRRGLEAFSSEDVHFLEALAGSITIAVENAHFYAQMRAAEATLRTQVGALRRDLARHDRFSEMIGTSPAMAEVFALMETAAASAITVLIEGETGTGKELVARGIHRAGVRTEAPFLAVNCAAMPENLLESELFGHRRGAFTGAMRDNPGLFRAAAGGSVFLDEIGDMPLAMQAKLLRVLEEQEVVPVGENFPIKVDVRVMSATNRDLRAQIQRGTFREDLYYRIAVFPIRVPPLRERREDIPVLASRFLIGAAERHHKQFPGFDEAATRLLASFSWPGNVRELQNEIERAAALARDGETIGANRLSAVLHSATSQPPAPVRVPASVSESQMSPAGNHGSLVEVDGDRSLREARAAFEARYIGEILRECAGNLSRAAKKMGVSRVQLQRKVKEYGLR